MVDGGGQRRRRQGQDSWRQSGEGGGEEEPGPGRRCLAESLLGVFVCSFGDFRSSGFKSFEENQ